MLQIIQQLLRETAGALARGWVLAGAKKAFVEYYYVEDKWVSVTVLFDHDGHEDNEPPKRRASDAEIVERLKRYVEEGKYLAPETDARQAATDA
jgi:hypothetical protein